MVVVDANLRLSAVDDADAYRANVMAALQHAHLIKVSDDDLDALTGCNDPFATNFDPDALIPRTTECEYDIEDGSLLFQGSTGHVEIPSVDVLTHLPQREITMATWVKVNELTDARYASYISHMQDDFLVEKGFMLGNINLPELAAGISPVLSHSCAVFTDVHEGYQVRRQAAPRARGAGWGARRPVRRAS